MMRLLTLAAFIAVAAGDIGYSYLPPVQDKCEAVTITKTEVQTQVNEVSVAKLIVPSILLQFVVFADA